MEEGNNLEFDVVIIGGSFCGTSAGLLLRRQRPETRVLILERSVEFDRKVGESTSEMAGCFLTKQLGLTQYLAREHLTKHGLRMWFTDGEDQDFYDCSEVGGRYQARLPTFQLDRSTLDEKLVDMAREAGCEMWRPAKAKDIQLISEEDGRKENIITVQRDGETFEVRCKWLIDASGKASVLPRKLGYLKKLEEHSTNAIWARFRNVRDLDDWELLDGNSCYSKACHGPRSLATNHLMGYGWWVWLIPLKNGDLSAGLVYDSSIFKPEKGDSITETLLNHMRKHPVGKVMFENAEAVENDAFSYAGLPYFSEKVAGPGWAVIGDAAGFIDPLYSQGLDYCGHTISAVVKIINGDLMGEDSCMAVDAYNRQYPISYFRWYKALYKDKYYYLGDAELMWAAFLMDIATYFIGPVRGVYENPETEFGTLPYQGKIGNIFAKFMAFYNMRLAAIAQKRRKKGTYGAKNSGERYLLCKGFSPTLGTFSILFLGMRHWLKLEVKNLFS